MLFRVLCYQEINKTGHSKALWQWVVSWYFSWTNLTYCYSSIIFGHGEVCSQLCVQEIDINTVKTCYWFDQSKFLRPPNQIFIFLFFLPCFSQIFSVAEMKCWCFTNRKYLCASGCFLKAYNANINSFSTNNCNELYWSL